ncbi:MAG: metallophosphoesterase [Schleiferiaceae bacterium]|nr:metallophosphoesterase [Schleiferiaceae bacterium]
MSILLRVLFTLLFIALIDIYAFQAIKVLSKTTATYKYIFWLTSIAAYLLFFIVLFTFDRSSGSSSLSMNIMMGMVTLLYVPKLIMVVFMFGEDVVRVVMGSIKTLAGNNAGQDFLPSRRKFVGTLAIATAAIPFAGIIHGIWKGRYNFRVLREVLYFDDLPDAFDGFTITQLSDIHSGSFDNPEKIAYGIEMANAQKSDIIVFTGDLVNNVASEMKPWVDAFAKLEAPMGKYSVLGNHDYGDYVPWPSATAKKENLNQLKAIHQQIGFQLLLNDSIALEKNGEKLHVVGVENWGYPPFPQYGDLNKALEKVAINDFKVLLSHDPSHFDGEVKQHEKKVHLTLSGHTHGMQFGIEIPGWFRWSPVKYKYPKWAGLYEDMHRYLYVNRGFGFLAFPGRVGIWPEITVLELRKRKD